MFEKEAIIHAFEETIGIECLNKPVEDFTYEELSDELQEKAYDFKKGAEFGYNKAFVEADKNLKAIVTDFNKANKWHYVKDGDLPRQYGHTCFSIDVLANNKKWVYYEFSSGKWFCGKKEVKVIAWKEIELPKGDERR